MKKGVTITVTPLVLFLRGVDLTAPNGDFQGLMKLGGKG